MTARDLTVKLHVAEEPESYATTSQEDTGFNKELERVKLWALYRSADVQIGCLLRLANVLDKPSAAEQPADILADYASEIRQAASSLEELLHTLADSS